MPQTAGPVFYIAFELANKKWKVGFCFGDKRRYRTIDARDISALFEEIATARSKLGVPERCQLVSCYEAGRDGFWLHRLLVTRSIKNLVIDPASVQVDRRYRTRKTDRLDLEKLLKGLVRHCSGESGVWSVVRVPSEEVEDHRRVIRERERLVKERTGHSNRIRSLLITHGLDVKVNAAFAKVVPELRLWDGSPLGAELQDELLREHKRWQLVHDQVGELEARQRQMLRAHHRGESQTEAPGVARASKLADLHGIGLAGANVLGHDFFWRDFKNRRQVGAAAGITGTPFDSGDSRKEQGISKAGPPRIRALMVELSWQWLRFQPQSALSQWYFAKFAGSGRSKKVGIVALARRLLIALWRWVDQGKLPEGAILKRSIAVA